MNDDVVAPVNRAFLVRAGFENELVDQFLSHSAAYVGWDKLGDLSGLSLDRIDGLLKERYPESITASGAPNKHHREIIELVLNLKPGDMIVTPHRATRMLIIGRVAGSYRFDERSDVRSGHEVYRHSIPVAWAHAVSRDDLGKSVLLDTDQRGKTAFWLKPETARQIAAAPAQPIEGRHGRSSSGAGGPGSGMRARSSRQESVAKRASNAGAGPKSAPRNERSGQPQPARGGCCGCGAGTVLALVVVGMGLVGLIGLLG